MKTVNPTLRPTSDYTLGSAYDFMLSLGLANASVVNRVVVDTRFPMQFMWEMKGMLHRRLRNDFR